MTWILELVGAALIIAGVAMLHIPAAVIVAGLLCLVAAWAVS